MNRWLAEGVLVDQSHENSLCLMTLSLRMVEGAHANG